MGCNFVIPGIMRGKNVVTILNAEDDLRDLIRDYMGVEITDMYNEILKDKNEQIKVSEGDDYEKIADGLRNELVNIRDVLDSILKMQRISRKSIEDLRDEVDKVL